MPGGSPTHGTERSLGVAGDGGVRCGDDGSVVHQLQRAMDLEETDKDTLHLLVFLFMQFLSQPHVSSHAFVISFLTCYPFC